MSLVAIVGAGEIGAAAARALATRSRVSAIRLIDEQAGIAAGKALDLRQAGPISGSDSKIEGARDYAAAAGAGVIVIADPLSLSGESREWSGDSGLSLMRALGRLGCFEDSVVICAGAAQRELMQQSFDELRLSRRRLIGSAPEALAATARALVAIEAKVSVNQVILTVMGRPPDRLVIPWAEASIGGHSVASLLNAPQLRRLEDRLRGLWPPGPGALGTTAALFCEAVTSTSRRLFSAFVSTERENGTRAPVCAWPVSMGSTGVDRTSTPTLIGRDRVVIEEVLS